MIHLSISRLMKGLAVAAVFALVSHTMPALAQTFPSSATSQEYKLVLKPGLFATNGFAHYWDIAKKVATDSGLRINEKSAAPAKTSLLRYLDDASFSLDSKGYILRVVETDKILDTVTLKYRSPDPAQIKLGTIELAASGEADTEYQDDVIGFINSEVGKNSVEHSLSAKVKKVLTVPEPTLSDYATLFPILNKLGLDPSTKLIAVSGMLLSRDIKPGAIIFKSDNGRAIKAELAMASWSVEGKSIVGEISFAVDLKHASPKTIARFQTYFAALQTALAGDLLPGTSKVALLYRLQKAQ